MVTLQVIMDHQQRIVNVVLTIAAILLALLCALSIAS